jgi:hypothetical protein
MSGIITPKVGEVYGSDRIFARLGKPVYCEFKIIAIGTNILIEILESDTVAKQRGTVSHSQLRDKAVLLREEGYYTKITQVHKVVRVEKQTSEIYISEYSQTWIDRLYNKYCSLLGRDRSAPKEYVIDSILEDDKPEEE